MDWVAFQSAAVSSLFFGLGTAAFASLVVLLDGLIFKSGHESYLKVTHGFKATTKTMLIWAAGAGLVAFLGTLFSFYKETPQAILLIAMTWHAFLKQVDSAAKTKSSAEEVQKEIR